MTAPEASTLRDTVAQRPVIGPFLKLPRPEVVDLIALEGFDLLICDMEHGQITEREAREVILAARRHGLPVLVRTPWERGLANRLLEAGAAGLQVPHVHGSAQARLLAAGVRYPPEGDRSASPNQPAADYGRRPTAEYLRTANDGIMLVGQLESTTLPEDLDEIVAALDIAFIGPFDLSVDAGHPGETDHPVVAEATARITDAARRHGTALGTFAAGVEQAERAIADGHRLVAVSSDIGALAAGLRRLTVDVGS